MQCVSFSLGAKQTGVKLCYELGAWNGPGMYFYSPIRLSQDEVFFFFFLSESQDEVETLKESMPWSFIFFFH